MNDIVIGAMNMEVFFETGLEIRDALAARRTRSCSATRTAASATCPVARTTPRAGWKIDESYAVPDLIPQAWAMPVILHPDSARRAVEASLELIGSL